jgi:hypothetical protein
LLDHLWVLVAEDLRGRGWGLEGHRVPRQVIWAHTLRYAVHPEYSLLCLVYIVLGRARVTTILQWLVYSAAKPMNNRVTHHANDRQGEALPLAKACAACTREGLVPG